jgi:hypothetical protein
VADICGQGAGESSTGGSGGGGHVAIAAASVGGDTEDRAMGNGSGEAVALEEGAPQPYCMHNDMEAACETRKPLILAGQGDVSKLTLYETSRCSADADPVSAKRESGWTA